MTVATSAKAALKEFETQNPKLKGKAYLTSGSRTWEDQLSIILDPKRKANYLNIKKRFKTKYSLKELPKKTGLTKKQTEWWKTEIMKQAGKSTGFPHVGGKAQDISVKKLDTTAKKKLKESIEGRKLKILMEKVTRSTSTYGVTIESANVFHVYTN